MNVEVTKARPWSERDVKQPACPRRRFGLRHRMVTTVWTPWAAAEWHLFEVERVCVYCEAKERYFGVPETAIEEAHPDA